MTGESGPTVLVVDDERALADVYGDWLRDRYEVVVVHTGEDALTALDEHDIDVALLDRHMPELSGDEVLVSIRSRGLDVRVAMVTGVTPDFDVLDMGFDDYLVKPVDRETLTGTVETLVDRMPYESLRSELSALRVKRNVLEMERRADHLEADERYAALLERIERLERLTAEHRSRVTGAAEVAGD
jgi:DNA-binding response OmpR family regulator